jgi:hypothetical protein
MANFMFNRLYISLYIIKLLEMKNLLLSRIIIAYIASAILILLGAYFFISLANKQTGNYLFIAGMFNFILATILLYLYSKNKRKGVYN